MPKRRAVRGRMTIGAYRAKRRKYNRPRARARFRSRRNYRTGGFMGIELKFLDVAWNGVAILASTDGADGEMQPSSGCTNALSIPAQGDGESQRDGRKYTLKSVWVSGVIATTEKVTQTTVEVSPGFFVALVLDTQANGATIVSENVFLNPSTSGVAMLPQPVRNLQNSKRYRVLAKQFVYRKRMNSIQDAATTASFAPQRSSVNLSWKGNLVCDSVGTTADVASASDYAIHLIAYTDSTAFTPVFTGKARTRFVG